MAQQDIIDELNYLNETKGLIKQAIIGKGQTIATDTPFREYATKINNISEVEKNYMTLDPELRNTLKSTYSNSNWYIGDYSISINSTTFKITITNLSTSETYQVDMPEIDFTNKSGGFYVFKANNANEYNIYFAYMGPTGEISEYNQPIRVNKYVLNVYMQQCVTKFTDKLIGNFYYNHASLKLLQLGKTDNFIIMIATRAGWSPYPTTFYWYHSDNDNVTTFTYGSDITSNRWVSLNEKCFYASNEYSGYIFMEKDGSWQPMTCGFFIYGVNNLNNKIIGQYPKSAGNETTIYTANIELNSSGSYVVSPKQVLIPNGTWGATDWYHFNGGYAHWLDDYNAILMINIGNNTSPSSIRLTTVDTLNQTFDSDTLTLSTKQLTQTDKMDTSKFYATVNNTNYVYQVSAEGIEVEVGLDYENKEYYLPDNLELGTSADLLSGKSAILGSGLVRGTMPNNGALSYTPTTSQQTILAGYTSGGTIGAVTSAIDSNIQASNIKAGVTILGVQGNVEPDKPDQTKSCTPTTSQQVIEPDTGYELTSVTVAGVTNAIDQNIVAENIKKDVTILGVTGTLESSTPIVDATAVAEDILKDKVAYNNNGKVTGILDLDTSLNLLDYILEGGLVATERELYTDGEVSDGVVSIDGDVSNNTIDLDEEE